LGGVCKECNSGWMSQLEANVKPWFWRAVSTTKKVLYLDRKACSLLSTWVTKTDIALNWSSNYRKLFSADFVRGFGKKREPSRRLYIDLAFHGNRNQIDWVQSQWFMATVPDGSLDDYVPILSKSFKITTILGPFTFRLC
jgi:hypothetical protein